MSAKQYTQTTLSFNGTKLGYQQKDCSTVERDIIVRIKSTDDASRCDYVIRESDLTDDSAQNDWKDSSSDRKTIVLKKPPTLNMKLLLHVVPPSVQSEWYDTVMAELGHFISPNRRTGTRMGDAGIGPYTVKFKESTVERPVPEWTPGMRMIRDCVHGILKRPINIVIVNFYPNGNAHIKPHRDKELVNVNHPEGEYIAGFALGSPRMLVLQNKDFVISVNHVPGSIYLLETPTNRHWTHSKPKMPMDQLHISLTFRYYVK